jgi:hypothetical protein
VNLYRRADCSIGNLRGGNKQSTSQQIDAENKRVALIVRFNDGSKLWCQTHAVFQTTRGTISRFGVSRNPA